MCSEHLAYYGFYVLLNLSGKNIMPAPPFDEEIQDIIIAHIIAEVESRGSARVGYHAEKILDVPKFSLPYNIISKIEAKIILDKRYKSRPYPAEPDKDYEILLNPDYKKLSFWDKHPYIEKLSLVFITASLTLLANYLLSRSARQSQHQVDKQQDSLIKDITDSLQSLKKAISH